MKYTKVLAVLLVVAVSGLHAQSPEVVEKYNEGVAAAKAKDYTKAIDAYTAAIAIDPLYGQAYYSRGLAKMSQKEYKAAAVDFKKMIKLDGENAKAHYYSGYCLMSFGQNEEAIKAFSRGLNYDPSLTKVYYYRAKIQMLEGNYEKAIVDFQETIAEDEPTAKVYYQLGVCYLKTDKADLADQSFGLAIKKNEKYVPALTERMKLKYKKEDYPSAVDLANGIIALESDNEKALYYKALALMKSESYDDCLLYTSPSPRDS